MSAEPDSPIESLLVYPTEFPVKVMGKTQTGFAQAPANQFINGPRPGRCRTRRRGRACRLRTSP